MNTRSARRKQGGLLILIGPAGAGKTTLEKHLLVLIPDAQHVISNTTRTPRADEVPGEDYDFVTTDTFIARIEENYYAEYEQVHGRYYGTPKITIEKTRASATLAISPIDYKGARKLIGLYPDAIPIFLQAPPLILIDRLYRRGKDMTQADIVRRMKTAEEELAQAHTFPHIVDTTGPIASTLKNIQDILGEYDIHFCLESSE